MSKNNIPLYKKVCQDCINDIAKRRYGGCFAWNAYDDANWSEGSVDCPGDYSVDGYGEGDGHYPIDKVPNHCPHAERHAQAAAQPEWCIVRGDKFGPCKNQFCRESEGEWSTCEYDSRPFEDQDNRALQNHRKEKMKRFKKGTYHVGGLIATTLIESTVFGTVCEFDRDSSLYPNGMYRIELLNGSGENRWIDADAVWNLDEIRRRKAYLEELDKLIATFESGSIIWELLMQEKRDVEQIAPPEDMEETLERAEKERRSTPDGC